MCYHAAMKAHTWLDSTFLIEMLLLAVAAPLFYFPERFPNWALWVGANPAYPWLVLATCKTRYLVSTHPGRLAHLLSLCRHAPDLALGGAPCPTHPIFDSSGAHPRLELLSFLGHRLPCQPSSQHPRPVYCRIHRVRFFASTRRSPGHGLALQAARSWRRD